MSSSSIEMIGRSRETDDTGLISDGNLDKENLLTYPDELFGNDEGCEPSSYQPDQQIDGKQTEQNAPCSQSDS